MAEEMTVVCPHCKTLLTVDGAGEYTCPHCNTDFGVSLPKSEPEKKLEPLPPPQHPKKVQPPKRVWRLVTCPYCFKQDLELVDELAVDESASSEKRAWTCPNCHKEQYIQNFNFKVISKEEADEIFKAKHEETMKHLQMECRRRRLNSINTAINENQQSHVSYSDIGAEEIPENITAAGESFSSGLSGWGSCCIFFGIIGLIASVFTLSIAGGVSALSLIGLGGLLLSASNFVKAVSASLAKLENEKPMKF